MDEENIKYIPDADHQHLQSQEREQEFVEEEKYWADSDKFDQSGQDLLTCEQELFPSPKEILEDFRTPEEERIQEKEKILEDFRTRMQERIQKIKKILEDFRTRREEIIQKREKILEDIRTLEEEIIQEKEKIREHIRIPVHERLQKIDDKTTKTTKSRYSTITSLLLGSVCFASRFYSVGAEFIPVESDLSLCKTDLSKLTDICDHDEGKAIHCVLNDEGELGIGCFSKIWVKQGYCPYFRNSFGVLDIRPCLGNSSICPTYHYLSNGVYKYPGCLINSSTGVLDILTNETTKSTTIRDILTIQTTQSMIIRSSDAGVKETMLLILVVIFGLISLTILLFYGLRFLRTKKNTLRGQRSAYAPASKDQQDPHDLPDDSDDV